MNGWIQGRNDSDWKFGSNQSELGLIRIKNLVRIHLDESLVTRQIESLANLDRRKFKPFYGSF